MNVDWKYERERLKILFFIKWKSDIGRFWFFKIYNPLNPILYSGINEPHLHVNVSYSQLWLHRCGKYMTTLLVAEQINRSLIKFWPLTISYGKYNWLDVCFYSTAPMHFSIPSLTRLQMDPLMFMWKERCLTNELVVDIRYSWRVCFFSWEFLVRTRRVENSMMW